MRRQVAAAAVVVVALLAGAACDDGDPAEDPSAIKIGANVALSGSLAQFGTTWESVVRLAIDEINAQGGIDGRPLALVTVDDRTDATQAAENTRELIDRGVVAMIGPDFSGAVEQSLPEITGGQLVTITGSATAPDLAADDDGLVFRTVPDDNLQGIAMARFLDEQMNLPDVAVVYQDDAYGRGLRETFGGELQRRGGTVLGELAFTPSIDGQQPVDDILDWIAGTGAPMVVLITFSGDGAKIIQGWDDRGAQPDVEWFFTDGVRDSNFAASRPSALEGMRGTAPTHAANEAFDAFAAAYLDEHGEDITQEVFQANYYDAVYLLALAMTLQQREHPGEPLGGPNLAQALLAVSRPAVEGETKVWPADFRDAAAAIQAGEDIDYDGASGPCDFEDEGETAGPVEVWRISNGMYVQDHYYDATELAPTP